MRPGLLVLAAALASCRAGPRSWDQPGGTEASTRAPPLAPSASATAPDQGDAGESLLAPEPPPIARAGGAWVRCYGAFHPSGEPGIDVTRLGLLCGPSNGMTRLSTEPFSGTVVEGASETTRFKAAAGDCYRVFAVGAPSIADLDVTVRSSRGAPIATDHGEDAWPVVQPDRPFCALDDDELTVEVRARKGAGAFAAEVWRLHPRPRP